MKHRKKYPLNSYIYIFFICLWLPLALCPIQIYRIIYIEYDACMPCTIPFSTLVPTQWERLRRTCFPVLIIRRFRNSFLLSYKRMVLLASNYWNLILGISTPSYFIPYALNAINLYVLLRNAIDSCLFTNSIRFLFLFSFRMGNYFNRELHVQYLSVFFFFIFFV